jgi:phosphosulfolactate synthase
MNLTALRLPARTEKPRRTGLTMVIDGGIPSSLFADLISSAAEYIDMVKFGWGTAVVTGQLGAKIDVLNAHQVGFYSGGTLFEKFLMQGRLEDFRKFCRTWSCLGPRARPRASCSVMTRSFTSPPRWPATTG